MDESIVLSTIDVMPASTIREYLSFGIAQSNNFSWIVLPSTTTLNGAIDFVS